MTDWTQLTHAYGIADDVPRLLEQAAADAHGEVWTELWSRLCHQGTVYPASFAALPVLTSLARQSSGADRFEPLVLAAAIVASTDRPHDSPDPRVDFAAEVAELTDLTEQSLHESGPGLDQGTYIYLLQGLLGLEGVAVWGEWLDGINSEEYEVPCPSCGTMNTVVFGEYGHFTTLDSMYMTKADGDRIPLQPKQPHELGPLGSRLHARVLADGHPDLADKLTYVFGSAQCALCGTQFQVDQAVVAARSES